MRHLTAKDRKRRVLFSKTEFDQFIFKILHNNKQMTNLADKKFDSRIKSYFKYSPRDQYATRIRNRCVISGKSGWIFSKFKVSRMQFREMFGKGYFYGLKRSSW